MYKLIIADDQSEIRKGLVAYFRDGELGFIVERAFEDGESVIEYLKENQYSCDVVLTDIKMAKISGIDVAQYIHNHKLGIKTVLLSSYKEFEYAQKAIGCGVYNYLLKPISFQELDRVFMELKEILDAELHPVSTELDDLRMLLLNQVILEIYAGNLKSKEILYQRIKSFYISDDFLDSLCTDIVIKRHLSDININKWEHGIDRFDNVIINSIQKEGLIYHVILNDAYKLQILAMPSNISTFREIGTFRKMVEEVITHGVDTVKQIFNINIEIESFTHCASIFVLWEKQLANFDLNKKLHITEMLEATIDLALDGITDAGDIERNEISNDLYNILNRRILKDLKSDDHESKYKGNTVITKVLKYMHENFEKDISLVSLAEMVSLNPSYLSKLFKICTGEYFSDYLINIRMNKAMELLRDESMTVKKVGNLVGYYNDKYFMRLFKSKTGKTPSEFRSSRDEK